jgi:glycine betaine/choline ABC-type transport system substrate-binding protein
VPNVDEVVLPIYENLPKKKPIKQEVIDIEPFHNPTLKSLQSKIDQSGFINLNYR